MLSSPLSAFLAFLLHLYILYIHMKTAKLFRTGGSQAVRLPKEFRLEGSEVYILQEGDRIILLPKKKKEWPPRFFRGIRIADPRFARLGQPEVPPIKGL